ncbi:MAG: hypothetical protein ACI92Z_000865 [Paracoccaceae bacterium]
MCLTNPQLSRAGRRMGETIDVGLCGVRGDLNFLGKFG